MCSHTCGDGLADPNAAININIDGSTEELENAKGTLIHNIKIANNKIVNARTAAIGIQYAKDVEVFDNELINPMAAGLQTAFENIVNYNCPAAILLNAVANVHIKGNKITLQDPALVPEVSLSCAVKAEGSRSIRQDS